MNHSSPPPLERRGFNPRALWVAVVLLLLAACSNVDAPHLDPAVIAQDGEIAYVALVDIDKKDKQADIEAYYGATAITFKPKAGFAVLGFGERQGELTTLSVTPNQDALGVPEVTASGYTAWADGYTAWADGFTAWAGGYTAWAGGFTAWAGGVNTTFGENLPNWALIDLEAAHQHATNLGQSIKVAVIDTGIDLAHPAFAGKLVSSSKWMDFVDGDTTPQEVAGAYYGHGTGVAGIVLQVAPHAEILPIRVLDGDGMGDLDDVILAIDHAILKGAQVINLSLGSSRADPALSAMLTYARDQGVFVAASAGNEGSTALAYPARWGGSALAGSTLRSVIVGVGSVGASGALSGFSNRGAGLDLVAPGEGIVSTYPDGQRAAYTGTSFAAPVVAGAMALKMGELNLNKYKGSVADEVEASADQTLAIALDPFHWSQMGHGILDVDALVGAP